MVAFIGDMQSNIIFFNVYYANAFTWKTLKDEAITFRREAIGILANSRAQGDGLNTEVTI